MHERAPALRQSTIHMHMRVHPRARAHANTSVVHEFGCFNGRSIPRQRIGIERRHQEKVFDAYFAPPDHLCKRWVIMRTSVAHAHAHARAT